MQGEAVEVLEWLTPANELAQYSRGLRLNLQAKAAQLEAANKRIEQLTKALEDAERENEALRSQVRPVEVGKT